MGEYESKIEHQKKKKKKIRKLLWRRELKENKWNFDFSKSAVSLGRATQQFWLRPYDSLCSGGNHCQPEVMKVIAGFARPGWPLDA